MNLDMIDNSYIRHMNVPRDLGLRTKVEKVLLSPQGVECVHYGIFNS
jgi:hypothetical protein